MTAAPLLLAVLLLPGLAASGRIPPARMDGQPCRPISGLVSAGANRLMPTLKGLRIRGTGMSEGDLRGAVALEVFKPFSGGGLAVEFTVSDAAGVVTARGRADSVEDPTQRDVHVIRSQLRIVDSADSGYRGAVTGTGTVNTRTRRITLQYAGELCASGSAVVAKGGAR